MKVHVDRWSGSREGIFFKILAQSNMAARPCDLSIIHEQPGIPKVWGTCVWSFPSICPADLEKVFKGFRVNTIWLSNHVTYNVISHMVWQPYWIYPETYKNLLLQNGSTDQGETSQKCSPSLGDTRMFTNNWHVTLSGNHIGLNESLKKYISLEPLHWSTWNFTIMI